MDELIAWLRAQLDEDGAIAQEATEDGAGQWHLVVYNDDTTTVWNGGVEVMTVLDQHDALHVRNWDPARVLAEVAAKRQRLDYLASLEHDRGSEDFPTYDSCRVLPKPGDLGDLEVGYCSCGLDAMRDRLYRIEAAPYADRPGYREEWRP